MMMLMVRWPAPPCLRPPEFAEDKESDGEGWSLRGNPRERDEMKWKGGGVFIYILYGKLHLTTLMFILNYIFSPKVYIYYCFHFFPS